MRATTMLPNSTEVTGVMIPITATGTTVTPAEYTEEEAKIRRAREYRKRYKQKQKEKDKHLGQRVAETEAEIERLRIEQVALIGESHALSSLTSYSNSMYETLLAAASASAATARSLGGIALEGLSVFHSWVERIYATLPSTEELLTGSFWTPPDDLLRWFLKRTTAEQLFHRHPIFIERIEKLFEDGKKSAKAKKHAEVRINYLLSLWRRITTIAFTEQPELMLSLARLQLKHLRAQSAAGTYVCPSILQDNPPPETSDFIELSPEQRLKLEEHWKQFFHDIKKARSILGRYTSKVGDKVEATMDTGRYNPASSANAAQCFLLTMDVAEASEEFLAEEGRAFIKLWFGAVHVLTPMQVAVVITKCSPLMTHLPDICNMLLNGKSNSSDSTGLVEYEYSMDDIHEYDYK